MKNIYESGELDENSTCAKIAQVQTEGKRKVIRNLSNYPILQHKGTISALEAKIKADTEYEKYKVIQDQIFESDFDKEVKRVLDNNPD